MTVDKLVTWLVGTVVIVLLLWAIGCHERATWRECRRYHPVWYCLERSGK
jgi:uncharacterized membrane protein YdcZ (DUF606 family)